MEAYDRPCGAMGLDIVMSVSPDDSDLVEPHCPPEPCLIWVHGFVHVIAIQAECRLEASGIACSQPGRKDAGVRAVFEYRVPDLVHPIGGDEFLEAIFTGVTRARDQRADSSHGARPKSEIRQVMTARGRAI